MEISNSMQSTNNLLVNQTMASSNKKIEEEKEENQKNDGYNTTSKLYFELSEDISKYQINDVNQDEIDKDVMNIYNKYSDKNSFTDFIKMNSDINPIYSFYTSDSPFRSDEFSKYMRENEKILQSTNPIPNLNEMSIDEAIEAISKFNITVTNQNLNDLKSDNDIIQDFEQKIKDYFKRDVGYGISANFKYHSDEELEKISKENFKNLYRFSDEFAKSEKFNDLYIEWKDILNQKETKANELGKNFIDYIYNGDLSELEKNYIINKNYSKSEWIESIDKSKTLLEDIIKDNPNMQENVKVDMQNNIKFYENILTDLKELWHYGDFKVNG